MKVEFKLLKEEAERLRSMMEAEHAGYYAVYGDGYAERRAGYFESLRICIVTTSGTTNTPMRRDYAFKWVTQGGNVLSIVGNKAMYKGRRHGLVRGGFLSACAEILRPAQDRGDWRYIATNEKSWLPLETADDWPDQ